MTSGDWSPGYYFNAFYLVTWYVAWLWHFCAYDISLASQATSGDWSLGYHFMYSGQSHGASL